MYNIEWTDPAWEDINELIDREEDFQLAEEIVKRILQAPEHLSAMPWSGKPGRVPNTRELLVPKTRYSLVYSVSDTTVVILRVIHSSRLFPPVSGQNDKFDE